MLAEKILAIMDLDVKKQKPLETALLKKAWANVSAKENDLLKAYLGEFVRLFLEEFFEDYIDKNVLKMKLDDAQSFIQERLAGRVAFEQIINKNINRFTTLKIRLNEYVDVLLDSSYDSLYIYVNETNYYRKSYAIYEDGLDDFCDVISYILDNFDRWKTKAEKDVNKFLKARMKAKISETAFKSLVETSLNTLGLEYIYSGNKKTTKIKIKLTEDETGIFYLKHDNLQENLKKIVELAAHLRDYLKDDNKIQIRFKSMYDGLHQYDYEHRFDKYKH